MNREWTHPDGKLREQGAASLSDAELLAILIATGIPGKSTGLIAEELLARFGGLNGPANQSLERLLAIKGLGTSRPSVGQRPMISRAA